MNAKVVRGEYSGQEGTLKSILWAANVAVIETKNGKEITPNIKDIQIED